MCAWVELMSHSETKSTELLYSLPNKHKDPNKDLETGIFTIIAKF